MNTLLSRRIFDRVAVCRRGVEGGLPFGGRCMLAQVSAFAPRVFRWPG